MRPNGLVGELHGPFTGELVSAAVPMDSRRRFKRVGLRLASLLQPGNRQRGVSCELLAQMSLREADRQTDVMWYMVGHY